MIRPVPAALAAFALFTVAGCASQDATGRDGSAPIQTAHDVTIHGRFPGTEWQHADPASLGWDVAALKKADDYERQVGFTSAMVVRHGVVVDEWGDTHANSPIYSSRKSFMSALYGIARARGQIDVDATLAQLGVDDNAPSLTAAERQATLLDLLKARSGVYHHADYETATMVARRPERGSHAPGTFWYYNNWDFNTLGAIYAKATGTDIFEAVQHQIAEPIGMQDFTASEGRYVRDGNSDYAAYTMRMSTRDMARFGLLYLNQGNWNGNPVVPADWVAKTFTPYSDTGRGGYGLLWWTNEAPDGHIEYGMPASYWAEGNFGQFTIVTPALDLVVVLRFDTDGKRRVAKSDKIKASSAIEALWLIEAASGAARLGEEPRLAREAERRGSGERIH